MQLSNNVILKVISIILVLEGLAMIPSAGVAFYNNEQRCATAFCIMAIFCACVGFGMRKIKYAAKRYRPGEGFLIVIFCWLFMIFIGAMPYFMSNHGYSFVDCIFESASGWTTTGSTVIKTPLTQSLLLWKTVTGWLGGMIVIIFTTALLPYLGIGAQKLAITEIPGPDLEKMAPKFGDIAKITGGIYILLTVVFFLLLLPSRMTIYYSLIHTLSTISTSGVISLNAAQGNLILTNYTQAVLMLAAFTGAMNYFVFFLIFKKRYKTAIKNYEARLYILFFLTGGTLVSISLIKSGVFSSSADATGHAFMQVISFGTTTGFRMSDLSGWPTFCKTMLIVLAITGGCTFSASGGIKVIRFVVVYKLIIRGIYKRIHPKAIKPVMFEKKPLPADIASTITSFVILYFGVFMLGSILIALDNMDMETTFSAVIASISTNGAAFGLLSNADFSIFSSGAKLGLSLLMLAGRLELYPVIVLFCRSFWNPDKAKA